MNEKNKKLRSWDEVQIELYTKEEINNSNVRVSIITELIKARQERNISQADIEKMTGIKQSVISRLETGNTNPQLDTLLQILYALGKTIAIVDLDDNAV